MTKKYTVLALLGFAILLTTPILHGADWPQWLGPQRDGVWRETGILTKFPASGPKVLWSVPIGKGYTGPAVAENRVYVMDRQDIPKQEKQPKAADPAKGTAVVERVLCLDATNGKQIWEHRYNCHYRIGYGTGPRTTPVVRDGKVYTLGAMGDLFCLDANSGKVQWSKNFIKDFSAKPPVWGWSASPVLQGDRLYCLVGGKDSAIVAFDKTTGKVVWRALNSEEVCYAPPILVKAGGTTQLIVWLSDSISGLNPENGQVHWTHPYPADGKPTRPGVSIATPRYDNGLLFVSAFYQGSMMVKLDAATPTASVVWRSKSKNPQKPDALNIVMGTPLLRNGHVYGVCGAGELRCLDAATGKQLWQTYKATGGEKTFLATAFIVPQEDRCFIFNDLGELIIAKLSPKGYQEFDRTKLIEPVQKARGRTVVWCHPAFANRCVYVRNDQEMRCVSLIGE